MESFIFLGAGGGTESVRGESTALVLLAWQGLVVAQGQQVAAVVATAVALMADTAESVSGVRHSRCVWQHQRVPSTVSTDAQHSKC